MLCRTEICLTSCLTFKIFCFLIKSRSLVLRDFFDVLTKKSNCVIVKFQKVLLKLIDMEVKEKIGTQMAQSQAPDYNQIEKAVEEAIELAFGKVLALESLYCEGMTSAMASFYKTKMALVLLRRFDLQESCRTIESLKSGKDWIVYLCGKLSVKY